MERPIVVLAMAGSADHIAADLARAGFDTVTSTDDALARLAAGERVEDVLAPIEEAVRRGTETVESLHRFSRQEPIGASELTDLNRLTDAALDICRARLAGRTDVKLKR